MDNFFRCSCGSEVIQIERSIEVIDREKNAWDASIYFAMFHYGTQNPRPTLRDKLRHCWQIIKTGKNYADDVIMSIEEARKMGELLLALTNEDKLKIDAEEECNKYKLTPRKEN